MSRRAAVTIAQIGFVVLLLLHLDFWRPQSTAFVFGVPVELAYRCGYLLLAWGYMWFLCARVWPDDEVP